MPDTIAAASAPDAAKTALVAEALDVFQRRAGYHKETIVEILEEFGAILLDVEEARRKAASTELLARAESAYEAVHGKGKAPVEAGTAYFRSMKALETFEAVGREVRAFMTSAVPDWFARRRPQPAADASPRGAAQTIADAWFPRGHHDNVLLAEDVESAIARFDSTGGVAASPVVVDALREIEKASGIDPELLGSSVAVVARMGDIHQHAGSMLATLIPAARR